MASLLTSLCRVGGEQICHRLDQPGYSVLPRLDIDPDATPTRGIGGYGADAGDPRPREQPPGLPSPNAPTKFTTVELAVKVTQSTSPTSSRLASSSLPSEDGTDS